MKIEDWRCKRCAKLLGRWIDARMEIKVGRSHEYLAGAPVTTRCRCGAINEFQHQQPKSVAATQA